MDRKQLLDDLKREILKSSVAKELRASIQKVLYKDSSTLSSEIATTVHSCVIKLQSDKEEEYMKEQLAVESSTPQRHKRKQQESEEQEAPEPAMLLAPGGIQSLEGQESTNMSHRKRVFKELFGDSSTSSSSGSEISSSSENENSDHENVDRPKIKRRSSGKTRPPQGKSRISVKTLFDAGLIHEGDKVLFRNTKKESTASINAQGLIEWVNPKDESVHAFQFVSQFSTAVDRNIEPIGSLGSSHNGWNNTYLITNEGEKPIRDVRDKYLSSTEQQQSVSSDQTVLPLDDDDDDDPSASSTTIPAEPQELLDDEDDEERKRRKRMPSNLMQDNSELERYKRQIRNRNYK